MKIPTENMASYESCMLLLVLGLSAYQLDKNIYLLSIITSGLTFGMLGHKQCHSQLSSFLRGNAQTILSEFVCAILVPMSLILSVNAGQYGLEYKLFFQMFSLHQCLAAVLLIWRFSSLNLKQEVESSAKAQNHSDTSSKEPEVNILTSHVQSTVIVICVSTCLLMAGILFYLSFSLTAVMIQAICIILQCSLQGFLPLYAKQSFTLGECAIVTQGVSLYTVTFISNVLQKYDVIFPDVSAQAPVTIYFMQVAVGCCLLMACLVYSVPFSSTVFGFYITFGVVFSCIAFPALYVLMEENFVVWISDYINQSFSRIWVCGYWLVCIALGIMTALMSSYIIPKHDSNMETRKITTQKSQANDLRTTNDKSMACSLLKPGTCPPSSVMSNGRSYWRTCVRKLFHVLTIIVFLPGIILDREMTCVAGTCCLVIFIMLDMMRLADIPPVAGRLDSVCNVFLDEQDQGHLILTPVYLLAGCVLPLWLYPMSLGSMGMNQNSIATADNVIATSLNWSNLELNGHLSSDTLSITTVPVVLLTGVLSLGIGDTMAAVTGITLGSHKWPGTNRTVEGTLGCALSQLGFLLALYHLGVCSDDIWWLKTVVAVVITSVVEAVTTHVDNLILPLVMYLLLI